MTKVRWVVALSVLLNSILLAACVPGLAREQTTGMSGRILLWHSLDDNGTAALDETRATFQEINPGVTIRTQRFPSQQAMHDIFLRAADSGLGPDLMLSSSDWLLSLAQAHLIAEIGDAVAADQREQYMPGALATVEYAGGLYGLPLAVTTEVLYFNAAQVDEPATTLDTLMIESGLGKYFALNADFQPAFWGVQAFGGRLLADNGTVILGNGGYANWLDWLKTARDMPGALIEFDQGFLAEQFVAGNVAYYVGDSSELPVLRDRLGDRLRVASLPSGPVGSAAPFLSTAAFLFSSASSSAQSATAVELAKFISNVEQSTILMRDADMVPANRNVRINPRLEPMLSVMAEQARSAIPLPNLDQRATLLRLGSAAQTRALEGVQSTADASATLTNALGEQLGLPIAPLQSRECSDVGLLRVANTLTGAMTDALEALTEEYQTRCPNVIVQLIDLGADQLFDLAERGSPLYGQSHLVVGDQALLTRLARAGYIAEISPWVTTDALQSLVPAAITAARVDNGLYMSPLALELTALYYNRELVAQPARSLDELRRQAQDGVPLTFESNFGSGFWGISAFGAQAPTAGFLAALDPDGLVAWLSWLQQVRGDARITLVPDHEAARRAFVRGESAYFVGDLADYPELNRLMDPNVIGAATLPAGPGGEASPLLQAVGLMLPAHVGEGDIELIRGYSRFLSTPESQRALVMMANLAPVNASTDLSDLPIANIFADQIRTAVVVPNLAHIDTVLEIGNDLYTAVLENGIEPTTAVSETLASISSILGVDVPPAATGVP